MNYRYFINELTILLILYENNFRVNTIVYCYKNVGIMHIILFFFKFIEN